MQFIALCADRTASIFTVQCVVCIVQYQEILSVHVLLVVFFRMTFIDHRIGFSLPVADK